MNPGTCSKREILDILEPNFQRMNQGGKYCAFHGGLELWRSTAVLSK